MRQPSPSPEPTSSAPATDTSETATEIVTRPDPGLARGTWEAPAWVFWVMLAIVVLGAAAYLLRRLGVLRLGRGRAADASPPSSRARRP
ncbi:MAG: hypothetical protein KF894_28230 [Labilithrix sp.]|nr:hypothetical protein [Labilithrix sp.]